jgi:diguanylate cyclase (GGDEF)-like protein
MSNAERELSYNSYWLAALVAGFTALMLYMVTSLGQDIEKHAVKQPIYHFADVLNEQTIGTIDQIESGVWVKNNKQNFGLTNASQWLKVDFPHAQNSQVLEVDYAMIDSIQIWFRHKKDNSDHSPDSDSDYRIVEYHNLGDSLQFSKRPIIHDKFLIPLPDAPEGIQLLLRLQSDGPIKAPLKLWYKQDYIVYTASHRLFMGLFFGYMLAMGLINLFLFVATRNVTFITYAGYVFFLGLLIGAIHGLGYRFIWPQNPWFEERAAAIFAFMMMSFVLVFSSQILELKTQSPKYHLVFKGLFTIYALGTVCSLFISYAIMIKLLLLLLLFSIPVILLVSLSLALKGSDIAKFFSTAWLVLLFSGLTASADNFHWIDLPIDSSYLLMVGATTETLLLALAVAASYTTQRRDARKAHSEAAGNELHAMQAQDDVLALQKQAQISLEEQVMSRTQEFEEALAGLSKVHDELQGMSETDTLTGLTNRRFFEKHMVAEGARSRREKQPLAVALLDIDNFKNVNDSYGHQCGDDCLIAFANTLKKIIKRPGDSLSRYGGEEFVILLPDTTIDGAKKVLEKFRLAVQSLVVETQGQRIKFTVSAGVTSIVIGADNEFDKMLAFADKLLYQAKEAGRNCIKSGSFE